MEERIKKLELITERLMRRAGKRHTALITPYPISNAVFGESVEGSILRYMFPCGGTITKGMVRINPEAKGATLAIGIKTGLVSKIQTVILDKWINTIIMNIPVIAGDCIDIQIQRAEKPLTEVWISFLWTPIVKDIEAKSFLIEELENDLQERTKELTAE